VIDFCEVFRELLQNADDAGAKNFVIDFETPLPIDGHASNGTKPNLNSVKVCNEPKAPPEYSFHLIRFPNGP